MSYILDALRRADAERQQGQVPGLHAGTPVAVASEPAASRRWAWWAAGVVALLAGMGLLWALRPAPPAAVVAVAPAKPAPAPAPPVAAAPAPVPIVVSAPPVVALEPAASVVLPPAGAAAPAAAPASAPAPSPRVQPLASLPADQRRELPPLAVGGSVWSDSAASRFVILDGQVLREGDMVAPGLVLERLERKAAVLRWKDQRLSVPF